MSRLLFSLSLLLLVSSCGSLQPVSDNATRATLELNHEPTDSTVYAAPIFSVLVPVYLNESTVWYVDESGSLNALSDYIWVDSLSKAIQRELSLALARSTPFPENSRIDIAFARFILRQDGSGVSIAEIQTSIPSNQWTLPVISLELDDLWDPAKPESYLEGYQKLLGATAEAFSKELSSKLPPVTTPDSDSASETNQ